MRQYNSVLLVLLTLVVSLSVCGCVVDYQGVVLDAVSNLPVENAKVVFDHKAYETDEKGYFEINYITGFCSDDEFEIVKPGYQHFRVTIEHPVDNETDKGDRDETIK